MRDPLTLRVKSTANFPDGMDATTIERLGREWTGDRLELPFGSAREVLPVVGWADVFLGTACPVHVVRARVSDSEGYLVYGGDAGVRILNERITPIPGLDEHLPRGEGRPLVWVEKADDLPPEVRAVVQ